MPVVAQKIDEPLSVQEHLGVDARQEARGVTRGHPIRSAATSERLPRLRQGGMSVLVCGGEAAIGIVSFTTAELQLQRDGHGWHGAGRTFGDECPCRCRSAAADCEALGRLGGAGFGPSEFTTRSASAEKGTCSMWERTASAYVQEA